MLLNQQGLCLPPAGSCIVGLMEKQRLLTGWEFKPRRRRARRASVFKGTRRPCVQNFSLKHRRPHTEATELKRFLAALLFLAFSFAENTVACRIVIKRLIATTRDHLRDYVKSCSPSMGRKLGRKLGQAVPRSHVSTI